jgi:hypothetical protein
MPSVSAKQHRLMAAVASNPAVAKKTKIPQSVGKEFMEADKGKKFKGGGEMKESKAMVKKEIGFMKKKGAPKSMIKHEMKEAGMKKMASGGLAAGHKSADGIAMKGKTKGKEVKMAMGGAALGALSRAAKQTKASLPGSLMTPKPPANSKPMQFMSNALRGGAMKPPTGGGGLAVKGAAAKSGPQVPAYAQPYVNAQNAQKQKAGMTGIGSQMASAAKSNPSALRKSMAGLGAAVAGKMMGKKAGGLAAGHKEADGIAKKGKTKAMQVKMAGGGKTKKYC